MNAQQIIEAEVEWLYQNDTGRPERQEWTNQSQEIKDDWRSYALSHFATLNKWGVCMKVNETRTCTLCKDTKTYPANVAEDRPCPICHGVGYEYIVKCVPLPEKLP